MGYKKEEISVEELQGYRRVLEKYGFRAKLARHQVAFLMASAGVVFVLRYGVYYQYMIAVALMFATLLFVLRIESSIANLGDMISRDLNKGKGKTVEEDSELDGLTERF